MNKRILKRVNKLTMVFALLASTFLSNYVFYIEEI